MGRIFPWSIATKLPLVMSQSTAAPSDAYDASTVAINSW
jgi:hypothetical protein